MPPTDGLCEEAGGVFGHAVHRPALGVHSPGQVEGGVVGGRPGEDDHVAGALSVQCEILGGTGYCGRERQTEKETDRQRERQRERGRKMERERDRQRKRQTEREKQTERKKDREREGERWRERETDRQRKRQTERERKTERKKDRERDGERERGREGSVERWEGNGMTKKRRKLGQSSMPLNTKKNSGQNALMLKITPLYWFL